MSDLRAEYPNITLGEHTYNAMVLAARHALLETRANALQMRLTGHDTGLVDALARHLAEVVTDQHAGRHEYQHSFGACACGLVSSQQASERGHLDLVTLEPVEAH